MTRVVAIIQARMSSSRLPGKVLRELGGSPMLVHVLDRVRACQRVDDVVVATTRRPTDDPVAELSSMRDARVFRGNENDVLARFVGAAREASADVVVRITADCPLLDPETVDRVIESLDAETDYASNVLRRTFPRGLDAEVLHRDVLERLHRMARSRPAREHVTQYLHRCPWLFRLHSVLSTEADDSDLRWTVDTAEDLAMACALYEALGLAERILPYREVVAYVRAHRDVAAINAGVQQKPAAALAHE